MPFVRFARDKRGYEYVYLVHESTRGGRASRPIVLYWYRTPPGVKVGRAPFDEEMRQRLEAQNPDIRFDWRAIASAQPPPPDAEHWRERRRAEKAAKLARLKDERAEGDERGEQEQATDVGPEALAMPEEDGGNEPAVAVTPELTEGQEGPSAAAPEPVTEGAAVAGQGGQAARSRRRRRGRRRKQLPGGPAGSPRAAHPPAAPGETPAQESGSPDQSASEETDDPGAEEPADS